MPSWLGPTELILVLIIVLLVFGASRVPEIGRSLGKGIREFRGSVSEVKEGVEGKAAESGSGEPEKAESTSDKPSA